MGTRETVQSYASLFFWELPENKIRVFGLASPPAFILAFFLTVRFHQRFDKRNTMLGAIVLLIFASAAPVLMRVAGMMPPNGSSQLVSVLMLFVFLFYLATAILTISVLSALADVAGRARVKHRPAPVRHLLRSATFLREAPLRPRSHVAGLAIDLIESPTGAKPGQVAVGTSC